MESGNGRRRTPRRPLQVLLEVRAVSDLRGVGRSCAGARFVACNLSAGGLGIETLFALAVGDRLELELKLPEVAAIRAVATVLNVAVEKTSKHDVFKVGLRFVMVSVADLEVIEKYTQKTVTPIY